MFNCKVVSLDLLKWYHCDTKVCFSEADKNLPAGTLCGDLYTDLCKVQSKTLTLVLDGRYRAWYHGGRRKWCFCDITWHITVISCFNGNVCYLISQWDCKRYHNDIFFKWQVLTCVALMWYLCGIMLPMQVIQVIPQWYNFPTSSQTTVMLFSVEPCYHSDTSFRHHVISLRCFFQLITWFAALHMISPW